MTLSTAPAPVTTPTGASLPLITLPQGELLTVNSKDIPMIKDAFGPGRKWGTYDGGDHSIFIGQVLDHGSQEQGDVSPLRFSTTRSAGTWVPSCRGAMTRSRPDER